MLYYIQDIFTLYSQYLCRSYTLSSLIYNLNSITTKNKKSINSKKYHLFHSRLEYLTLRNKSVPHGLQHSHHDSHLYFYFLQYHPDPLFYFGLSYFSIVKSDIYNVPFLAHNCLRECLIDGDEDQYFDIIHLNLTNSQFVIAMHRIVDLELAFG